ncbi:hypothetical protein EDD15DRAFT_2202773 [Pisolithus albus]|nr:hypothetical protein EDD15DRAFT_2202773 [Pisolithus albus]
MCLARAGSRGTSAMWYGKLGLARSSTTLQGLLAGCYKNHRVPPRLTRSIRAITPNLMEHGSTLDHDHNYHDVAELQFQQDLRRAIEASISESNTPLPSSNGSGGGGQLKSNATTPSVDNQTDATAPPNSFLSERAQLERERLARLKRTHREEEQGEMSSLPTKRRNLSTSRSRTDERTHTPSTFSASSSKGGSPVNDQNATATAKPAVSTNPVIDQLFWDGELRPTANLHSMMVNRHSDSQKSLALRANLTVSKKSQIAFAIISSYSTSVSWIYEFFEPRTPVILVAQPDSPGRAGVKNVLPNWAMTVPFWRNGYGCQSIKHLRICCHGPSARSSTKLADCVLSLDLLVYTYLMQPFQAVWYQDDFLSIMQHAFCVP